MLRGGERLQLQPVNMRWPRSAERGQGVQGTSKGREGKQHFVADVLQTLLDGGFGLVQILRTAPCQ
jgi:hypothetical protein